MARVSWYIRQCKLTSHTKVGAKFCSTLKSGFHEYWLFISSTTGSETDQNKARGQRKLSVHINLSITRIGIKYSIQ